MSAGDQISKGAVEGNPLSEIEFLKREITQLRAEVRQLGSLENLTANVGNVNQGEWEFTDDDGNVIVIITGNNLQERFGVPANIVGLNTKGAVQFYVSAVDGKIYGVITMDEIKYLLDALVDANGEQRFFKVGTRNNGVAPEGVIDFGKPVSSVSLADPDFDNGLDEWNVLQQGYAESVLSTALPSKTILCMCVDANGNIFVGFSDTGSTFTSAVWWWNGSTWAALGTLNTGFNIQAIAVDSNGNVFAGGDDLTTSRVWKWDGATWAAHGTLSTSFNVRALILDSNDRLYAGTSNGTTSTVWYVDDGSTTWAALGTLTRPVRAMVRDSNNNIYITGSTSVYASKWDGASWSDIGGASTGNIYYSITMDEVTGNVYVAGEVDLVRWDTSAWTVINTSLFASGNQTRAILWVNNHLLVGRDFTSGQNFGFGLCVAVDNNGSIMDFGSYPFNINSNVYCLVKDNNGNIFMGGTANIDVVKYTFVDSWNAQDGYAEITAPMNGSAIVLGTRFAVTAGNFLEVTAANYLEAVGGVANAKCKIEFWDAVTGGTLVGSEEVFNRAIDDGVGALQELSDIVQVPVGTTYAVLVASVALDTATEATVRFDDFQVYVVDNFLRMRLTDEGLFAEKNGREFNLLNRSENIVTDQVVNIDITGVETTLFDEPVEANWLLTSENFIRFSLHIRAQMTTSRSCTFRVYLGGTVILTWSKGGAANIVELFDIDGKLVATGNSEQIVIATEKFMNVTSAASALSLYNGTGAKNNAVENNLKLTAQFSGALTSAVAYGIQVEKVNGVV